MLPRTIHQIGIAAVSYNRTAKEWETETEGSLISFPAGKAGEAAARWKAIELSDMPLHTALKRMVAQYPELQSRAWKMGELILNQHVRIEPDLPDDGLIATVRSRTEPDLIHQITFDGYHFRCDCEDYWRDNCPRVRWHSQRMCIHIGAVQTLRHLDRAPLDAVAASNELAFVEEYEIA
jgi:hypothetical protein